MNLFLTEARRDWLLLRRYPYQTLFANGFLLLLYFGFRALPRSIPGSLDTNSETTVLGYIVWTTLAICLAHVSSEIERDIQAGTIDRLLLSRYPLLQIALMRLVPGLMRVAFSVGFILLGLCLLGERLPSASMLIFGTLGAALAGSALGLMFGGVSLIMRPAAMLQMPICLLLLVGTAVVASHVQGLSLTITQLALLAAVAIALLWGLSLVLFIRLEAVARRGGTIKRS